MPTRWRAIADRRLTFDPVLDSALYESNAYAPSILAAQTYYPVLGGQGSGLFQPDPDEFKDLAKALNFLKFDADQAKTLYDLIGSSIKIASVAGALVGAYGTVTKVFEGLGILESDNEAITKRLESIEKAIEKIYGHLSLAQRKGLSTEAVQFRGHERTTRQSRWTAATSRTAIPLQSLQTNIDILFNHVTQMLDIETTAGFSKQDIIFSRNSFRQGGEDPFKYCTSPFVGFADNRPMPNYAHPASDGVAIIWDPGHFIDVLLSSLNELLLAYETMEPGFRSTAHYRAAVAEIAVGLKAFREKWQGSIMLANPGACMSADGRMINGHDPAPGGLLIGAIDPVTGVSTLQVFGNFQQKLVWDWQLTAHGSTPDRTYAVNPGAALESAIFIHTKLVRDVEKGSGLVRLRSLQAKFEELAKDAEDSQFVYLPSAKFDWAATSALDLTVLEGEDTTVDLGWLDEHADEPGKMWPAKRFRRRMKKTFVFQMARRAEVSGKQLGYKLIIGGKEIDLCPVSFRPAAGQSSLAFPNTGSRTPLTLGLKGAHCCQATHFSRAREDSFEKDEGDPDRVFVSIGEVPASVDVEVAFVPLTGNNALAFTGDAIVTITNTFPEEFENSYELDIEIRETVFGDGVRTEVISADQMTVYMTPSYLIVEKAYIDAFQRAFMNMLKKVKQLDLKVKYMIGDVRPPNPIEDPDWSRTRISSVHRGLDYLRTVEKIDQRLFDEEAKYLQVPQEARR